MESASYIENNNLDENSNDTNPVSQNRGRGIHTKTFFRGTKFQEETESKARNERNQ